MFIGPLLMHQKKDWKTYSRFANCLVTEKPEISALLACGTDGEKAVVDGFKRNPPYATFLRCFIHYKKNIEEHLENRGFGKELKKLFLCEICGVQNSDKKFFVALWTVPLKKSLNKSYLRWSQFGMQEKIMCQNNAFRSGSLPKR